MSTQSRQVVVGVDGSAENLGALHFGIAEARRCGADLRLVHVVPDYVSVSPMMALTPADLADTGHEILAAAERTVRDLAPDLDVEPWLYHGTRPIQLAHSAESGRVLVVGRDDRPVLERLLRGDTAAGVAARSAVPMVVVPTGWPAGAATGTVLVGVKSPMHATALLGDATALAAERGARLVVLHAWRLPSAYDDLIESRVAVDDWTSRAMSEMADLLAGWRAAYPDVEIDLRVVHDHAAHALVEASQEAELVVLVRRAHGVPAAAHLGAVSRAVLRAAHCPVRVVPPEPAVPVDEPRRVRAAALAT